MRDPYFDEPVNDVRRMEESYAEWLRDLFDAHGVCQVFTPRTWPYPRFGALTCGWRVPEGYAHVALSPTVAMGAGSFNDVLRQVDEHDAALRAIGAARYGTPVRTVAHALAQAVERGDPIAWVGEEGDLVVPVPEDATPLRSLGGNARGTLELTEDGYVRLDSDLPRDQEREWPQYSTNRCWVRQVDGSRRVFDVVCAYVEGDGRCVMKDARVDLTKVPTRSLFRLIGRVHGESGGNPFALVGMLYGGGDDPTEEGYPVERLADVVCRTRGRVVGRHDGLESAASEFYARHPLRDARKIVGAPRGRMSRGRTA